MKKQLLIAAALGLFSIAKSQVYTAGSVLSVYNDINPDKLLNYSVTPYTHNTYSIDIFGGTQYDVEMVAHGAISSGGSGAYISISSLDPNVFISLGRLDSTWVPATSTWWVTKIARPLNTGDAINSGTAVWDNTQLYLTDQSGSGGGNKNVTDWIGGDKYIGLKYQNGSVTDYAWIRVQCTSQTDCYIKDFSTTSMSSGIAQYAEDAVSFYPNPAGSYAIVRAKNIQSEGQPLLTDVFGKMVRCDYEMNAQGLKLNLESVPQGCYFLTLPLSGGNTVTKKIIKVQN